MNLASIIVLAVVVAALVLALIRTLKRCRKGGSCSCGDCSGCPGCHIEK